jgi:hypothetical protein
VVVRAEAEMVEGKLAVDAWEEEEKAQACLAVQTVAMMAEEK